MNDNKPHYFRGENPEDANVVYREDGDDVYPVASCETDGDLDPDDENDIADYIADALNARETGADRKQRTKLANLCEAVMVRVQELEAASGPELHLSVRNEVARKLRAAVVAATE